MTRERSLFNPVLKNYAFGEENKVGWRIEKPMEKNQHVDTLLFLLPYYRNTILHVVILIFEFYLHIFKKSIYQDVTAQKHKSIQANVAVEVRERKHWLLTALTGFLLFIILSIYA